jgi:transcriptional regulator with XRE-family HTH domain
MKWYYFRRNVFLKMMEKIKLIETRKDKGFSQKEVANMLCMDVSNYNRRENGQAKISTKEWQKLSEIMSVPIEDIFESEESQVFIFSDNATGNINSKVNYNIPLSMWENQKKYIEKLEKELEELRK